MSNPLLKADAFRASVEGVENAGSSEVMTLPGTINKSIILWTFLVVSAFYSWINPNITVPLFFLILIGALGLAFFSLFKKTLTPYLTPLYAICEGFILGIFSLHFERSCPGIVVNSVLLTICVLFCMLVLYKYGILKATSRFKKIVIISTLAIFLVYIADLILNVFGLGNFPYIHNSSTLSVIISFVIVAIASLNLIIDFDLIEDAVNYDAPKYMEWYCAFCLMITLIWLYIEVLRSLSKLKD
ncbi:MAG: Bax inhibitor-1/YccA family protein [Endomicrobiia bacterium]|nr:MAG: Bax inhibitor-1/YccA family protein [Endomicrobiia bacterium]